MARTTCPLTGTSPITVRARQVERALDDLRKGRVDVLLKLKDGKLNLPAAPTRDSLRKGLERFLR